MPAQIVVAEDEAGLRSLIADMLAQRELSVLEAADGQDAYERLAANPNVSLLLSDIRMPRMNGFELVEAALALRPELKVLMMTAYAQEQPPPALLRAREIRTLSKPFDLERLGDLVCEMLARP
jgi:DNA-binding NtrC family response regulator